MHRNPAAPTAAQTLPIRQPSGPCQHQPLDSHGLRNPSPDRVCRRQMDLGSHGRLCCFSPTPSTERPSCTGRGRRNAELDPKIPTLGCTPLLPATPSKPRLGAARRGLSRCNQGPELLVSRWGDGPDLSTGDCNSGSRGHSRGSERWKGERGSRRNRCSVAAFEEGGAPRQGTRPTAREELNSANSRGSWEGDRGLDEKAVSLHLDLSSGNPGPLTADTVR